MHVGTWIAPAARMDSRIGLAIEIIERDLAQPLGVAALAAHVNLSRSRFEHLFRLDTGTAPGRFRRSLRLERAAALMAESRLSVRDVMAAVGVRDPSHFARDFKRVYGDSPRTFRRWAKARASRSGSLPSV
jgi:transcriptional regulator GlxA family with amidase domain